MADRSISSLTALTTPASGDYLPIVDISEANATDKNKRITVEELLRGAPNGTAAAPGIAFESDDNTGIYSPGADQVAISTNGTRRISVDTSGTVLIGDGTLNAAGVGAGPTLAVNGSAPEITLRDTATGNPYAWIATNDFGSLVLAADHGNNAASSIIDFRVDGAERLRIDSSGRVGIGTTGPSHPLDVVSASTSVAEFSGPANATVEFKASGFVEGKIQCGGELIVGSANNYPVAFAVNNTERLRIDSSGRVGIGTSSPVSVLDVRFPTNPPTVNGNGDHAIRSFVTASLAADIGGAISLGGTTNNSGAVAAFGQIAGRKENATPDNYAGYLQFATNNGSGTMSERMRIDSSGRVGIGTSSPSYLLHVNNSSSVDTELAVQNGAGLTRYGARTSGNAFAGSFTAGKSFELWSANAQAMTIDSFGRVGIGTSSPGNYQLAVFAGNNANIGQFDSTAANGGYAAFSTSSTVRGYIGAGGNTFASAAIGDFGLRSESNLLFASGGSNEKLRIDSSGRLLVGTSSDSGGALLQVNDNRIRIATAKTPASASDTGTTGEVCWDSSYIYVCTATNTWKRAALSTW